MNQGAYSVHKKIRQELENYIKTANCNNKLNIER